MRRTDAISSSKEMSLERALETISKLQEEIERVQAFNREWGGRLAESHAENQALKRELDKCKKNDALKSEVIEQLIVKNEEAIQDKNVFKSRFEDCRAKNDMLEHLLSGCDDKIHKWIKKNKEKDEQIERLNERIQALENKLETPVPVPGLQADKAFLASRIRAL